MGCSRIDDQAGSSRADRQLLIESYEPNGFNARVYEVDASTRIASRSSQVHELHCKPAAHLIRSRRGAEWGRAISSLNRATFVA